MRWTWAGHSVLRGTDTPDPSLPRVLNDLAADLDEAYVRLAQSDDSVARPGAERFFAKARAVAALSYALSPDEDDHLEAIYEAIHAESDPVEATRIVESLLQ